MNLVIPSISIIISIFWIHQGIFRYEFWSKGTPDGGFIPTIFGVIILISSVVLIIRQRSASGEKGTLQFRAFIPILAAVAGIILLQLLGIAAAVFVFTLCWMKFLSKYKWLKSFVVSMIFTGFIFGIFRLWLRVPFPMGIFELL